MKDHLGAIAGPTKGDQGRPRARTNEGPTQGQIIDNEPYASRSRLEDLILHTVRYEKEVRCNAMRKLEAPAYIFSSHT
jgi:hypothetical protein